MSVPIYLWHSDSECLWIVYDKEEAKEILETGLVEEVDYNTYISIKEMIDEL